MKRTITDLELKNKKVLIRLDFNVPIKDGQILDDTRIKASLKTIEYALNKNAKVIIFSHLGRVKTPEDLEKNDLEIVAKRLSELLEKPVIFSKVTRGSELEAKVNKLKKGQVLLVQNTRYEDLDGKKESSNDEELGKYWSSLGDVFVNDAFGTAHRAHASNVGIANHLDSAIGFLIEKELNALEELNDPNRPFVVILGGSKVSTKIAVIENLLTKVDKLLIGGAMTFTFLKAQGHNVGDSLVEDEYLDYAKKLLAENPDKLVLPIDVNVVTSFNGTTLNRIRKIDEIADGEMGMDIGPKTIKEFTEVLTTAKTVLWNGPLGKFEEMEYANGTKKILDFITTIDAKTILGGGDIVAAASLFDYKDKVTHASTGGGATLEFLEGKELPGIEVIKEN